MSNRSKTRLYYAAAVCLIVVTAALRFWDLPGSTIRFDEAVAANNSQVGALDEVLENTRRHNSSPILYPLVLYAVQKVESSRLSVRIVPAVASVLTVAALLFLLPRVGAGRWAAFIAALLATGSIPAISHAQHVREYSVDALVAVLMTAGMLSYIRGKYGGGTYVLFCVSLFVAPLVQYGLVLFGAAALGTVAVMEGQSFWDRRSSLRDGLRFPAGWVWRRLSYFGPAVSFAAGCVISYNLTLVHQWIPGGQGGETYLAKNYYSGEYSDVPAMIGFVLSRTEEALRYHVRMEVPTMLGLVGFVVFLIVSSRKTRLDAVTALFIFSLGVAACAALIQAYPYGGVRQCLYLGPIVFLMFGHALHSIACAASSITRREWAAHAGMAVTAGVIAFTGMAAVWDRNLYRNAPDVEVLLLTLEQQAREGDVVFATAWIGPRVEFYHGRGKDGHCYGDRSEETIQVCARRLFWERPFAERMWLLGDHTSRQTMQTLSAEQNGLELVKNHGVYHLYVWEDPFREELDEVTSAYQYAASAAPDAQSVFDIYMRDGTLIYVKEPCVRDDVAVRFFLHVTPTNVGDLPEERKEYGFENLDFAFSGIGIVANGRCVGVYDLPEYEIENIGTGQFVEEEEHVFHVFWRGDIRIGLSAALLSAYGYAADAAPAVQSVFEVYVQERTLIYLKEPCSPDEAAARFFLHMTPRNVGDLPEERKEYGFDNLDFDFLSYGMVIDGKCIAVRDLPEYDVERILTGQFSAEEGRIWQGEVRLHE